MFRRSGALAGFTRSGHARRTRLTPVVNELEPRCLLSTADLTTVARVTAITGSTAIVQPIKSAYALNSASARVNFVATDPDDPGSTPVTHFLVADLTTNTTMSGTGTSVLVSAQGLYSVQFWSTDSDDSESAGAHSILIGLDRTAPVITQFATPNTLWPPNGKFVTVTVSGLAVDTLTGVNPSTLSFHVVDEYGTVQPSGRITSVSGAEPTAFGGDVLVRFTFQVQLQARRHGYDFDGRQYLIVTDARDMAGNLGSTVTLVTVPHDMGHKSGGPGTGATPPASPGNPGHQPHGKGLNGGHHQSNKNTKHGHSPSQNRSPQTGPQVPVIPIGTIPVEPGTGPGNGKGHHGQGNGNGNGNSNGHGHGSGNDNGNGHGHGHGG